jgi:hypothetical protein
LTPSWGKAEQESTVVNEATFHRCIDADAMLAFLRTKWMASERKLCLFAVECCRRAVLRDHRATTTFLPTAEKWADGLVDSKELIQALKEARVSMMLSHSIVERKPEEITWWAVEEAKEFAYDAGLSPELLELQAELDCGLLNFDLPHCHAAARQERQAQAAHLRDLFGPLPFRDVKIEASWRTPEVVALAKAIYNDGCWGDLPVLGDALTEAGCTDADVLSHCGGLGLHARGCWVVDAVLGKGCGGPLWPGSEKRARG